MKRKLHWALLIPAVILLGSPALSAAQEKAPPNVPQAAAPASPAAKAPVPTPDPKHLLGQMCEFLKQQQQFSVKAEVATDRVYHGGKKLQFGQEVTASFKRPDKLRIDGEGDLDSKLLLFDGKTLTLYDKYKDHYADIAVAGDIDAALDKAYKDHGLRVGLAELGSPKLGDHLGKDLVHALYVGLHKVRGVPCHHLAFDRKDIHSQVWVEAGDKPLLRKFVITQKNLPGSPQWTAYLSDWNFSPAFADNLFTFVPPAGAQKIKFMPVKSSDTPEPKPVKPKKKGGKS